MRRDKRGRRDARNERVSGHWGTWDRAKVCAPSGPCKPHRGPRYFCPMRRPLALALLLLPIGALSQPEIVPAEHAVYSWMADQRVAGHLPEYRHETLPYDRATVRRHLDSLSVHADRLGASGRFWLDEFRREFFEPLDRVHSYAGDGRAGLLDPDAERTFGYFRDSTWRVSIWGEGVPQDEGEDLNASRQARQTGCA